MTLLTRLLVVCILEFQSVHGIHSCFVRYPTISALNEKRKSTSVSATVEAIESRESRETPKTPHSIEHAQSSASIPELYGVDIRYNNRFPLTYDASTGRYLDVISTFKLSSNASPEDKKINSISRFLQSAFVPEGVTPSYYRFMRWRILQRFFNANVHVIGTQSLLMGLRGMHRSGNGGGVGVVATGAAAATNWVLKDTLGKIVRMLWASKMGRKFDPDAKRWRFRSSLIYALGNGLEVSTYLHPQFFLILG